MTKRSESESGSEPEPLMYGAAPMPEVVAGTDSMRAPASTIAPKPVPGPDTLPRQQLEAIRVPESQYEQREAVRASQSLPLHEV